MVNISSWIQPLSYSLILALGSGAHPISMDLSDIGFLFVLIVQMRLGAIDGHSKGIGINKHIGAQNRILSQFELRR